MPILPPVTEPPSQPFGRRHRPRPARGKYGYKRYRPCLRREFGFTCGFCLVHENDLSGGKGVQRRGLTTVEHLVLQKDDPARANDYSNCYYACRFCNGARGKQPHRRDSVRLLDPCADAWADHFILHGFQLVPREGNQNAVYTQRVYQLNDPRKLEMREERANIFHEEPKLLAEARTAEKELVSLWRTLRKPALLTAAKILRRRIREAEERLARLQPVPKDDPERPCCQVNPRPELPEGLTEQFR